MSGKRQKIQYSLALEPMDRGEAPNSGHEGIEPSVAKTTSESSASAEQLMEEVCDRETTHSVSPDSISLPKPNPIEPPWYVTRMPGGVGGVAPRGVPLSRSWVEPGGYIYRSLFVACQRASASCGFDSAGSIISWCTPVSAVNSTM
jgi:hypothetical protein